MLRGTFRRVCDADLIQEMLGQHYSTAPYSVLRTDRPGSGSAEYGILSAEEETPEHLGARLHLMSGDMGDNTAMIALPPA